MAASIHMAGDAPHALFNAGFTTNLTANPTQGSGGYIRHYCI